MIAWINFIILLIAVILFSVFYTISIQPVKRKQSRGEKAWKECERLRLIAGTLEFVIIINQILWIWFPIPGLNWQISPDYILGIIIGICISIPCGIVMYLGMKAAGSESLTPSPNTKMYGGIYQHIRHPQSLGEFPLFVAISFAVNSWFLVIITFMFILLYVPLMIYYEEKDLVLRFGDSYREYQKITGALFPKIKK